jgi:P-type E1-E2 ATPase
MLEVTVPDAGVLRLQHLVLDFNGTLACDGVLLAGVAERMSRLAQQLTVHVVTGDTFGSARSALAAAPCALTILPGHGQAEAKRAMLEQLGAQVTACIGNGNNDRLMLERAALSIAVMQEEGAAVATLLAADLAVHSVLDALDLLIHPQRLAASLRG